MRASTVQRTSTVIVDVVRPRRPIQSFGFLKGKKDVKAKTVFVFNDAQRHGTAGVHSLFHGASETRSKAIVSGQRFGTAVLRAMAILIVRHPAT
jgi:hypothetical protein